MKKVLEEATAARWFRSIILGALTSAALLLVMSAFPQPLFNISLLIFTTIFDVIFVFTVFPLRGRLSQKIVVLLVGNLLSFVWNGLYPAFLVSNIQMGDLFDKILLVINPWVNSLWMVSLWAVGVSFSSTKEAIHS